MLLMRLRGDITVNTCIDSKLERERLWTNKSSTAVKSDNLTAHIVESAMAAREFQGYTYKQTKTTAKIKVSKSISEEIKEKWKNKIEPLAMQGDFAKLLQEEKECVTWQSITRKVPRNVMAFAARLSTKPR
jgi:hypothetical protein